MTRIPFSRGARFVLCWSIVGIIFSMTRSQAQDIDVDARLQGFDDYMAQVMKDWNVPGMGVGIIVKDKMVFAKGYGYRDYGKKLPFTPKTLCPIASNTKLFTSVAAGFLVQEGKLTWDKPIRDDVPSIQFYNDYLNNNVTLRDMLAHRTGITRHDEIWFKSDFTPAELFDRIRYMAPTVPMRTFFIYNNMMFISAGHAIELKSGQSWQDFVRDRILHPLDMNSTIFSVAEMTNAPDFGVPYREKRDSHELVRTPYYAQGVGIAPAGGIISSIDDMSHWLTALMNDGVYSGRQILPPDVLKATLEPSMPVPNLEGEGHGYWELQNVIYGMGRETGSYRGHAMAWHNGALEGFYSQVSYLPLDHVGVIVFVIGEHCDSLRSTVTYSVFERLLGMSLTPWSERRLETYHKQKQAGAESRAKAGSQRVPNTTPSHPLEAYTGEFDDPAYGPINITLKDGQLQFDFHRVHLSLEHYHYDRFDTPDDAVDGKWSVNFSTNPRGDIDKLTMSVDEYEVVFTRKAEAPDADTLRLLTGTYIDSGGAKFHIVLRGDGNLYRVAPAVPDTQLLPYKGLVFHQREFSDHSYEFLMENGRVTGLKDNDPSGEYVNKRE